ncbi:hypothetical protein [Amycolatopsis taiwanensis]|uniref:hypothetical protein n=1 Tax=Amycolatopsis taiwanensis TaxID=342230 RepID=UPI000489E45F|nr:hypothetical protein [Amycolatopsis taiwanensis]
MTTPASAYAAAATTAQNAGFQDRVRAALLAACVRVGADTFTDPNQKAYFIGLSNSIIGNPDHYVTVYAWLLAGYSQLDTECDDADLDAAITSLWPTVSGYVSVQA